MTYKIVEVHWFDAQSSTEQLSAEDALKKLKPVITRSVGYLIPTKSDKYILLAFTDFGKDRFKHWQVIPKGMIEGEIKVIRK